MILQQRSVKKNNYLSLEQLIIINPGRSHTFTSTLTVTIVFFVILFAILVITISQHTNYGLRRTVYVKTTELKYARKTNEELDNIINTMAHDLKTPLTSILGFSQQVLERSLVDKLGKDDIKCLQKVYFSANYMKELIDSLLGFARVGTTRSNVEGIPLTDLIKDVRTQLHYEIVKRNAIVDIPKNMPVIKSDRIKLNQLFTNLISNAIKYVPKEREPKISIRFKESSDYYSVSISDNG